MDIKTHNGIAGILSFLVPGTGQYYNGRTKVALLWFVSVILGYFPWVFPGIVLHICCILNALSNQKL
jgi:hypothetical protein